MRSSIDSSSKIQGVKKIFLKLEGGLGNQFYQYATAMALAKKESAELVVLDRTDSPKDNRRHNHLGLFNCTAKKASYFQQKISRLFFVKKFNIGKIIRKKTSGIFPVTIVRDPESGFHPDLLKGSSGTVLLLGYWQSFKYFEVFKEVLIKEFSLKAPPLTKENIDLLEKITASQSVAIHIRRGDYVDIAFFLENFGTCSLGYYQNAFNYLNQRIKELEFFIFSDDPEWAEVNLSFIPRATVVKNNLGVSDYEDFRLMKECKHFIIANSSFSWWAAWLGESQSKIVISPSTWFKNDPMPLQDRIPSSWVKIGSEV